MRLKVKDMDIATGDVQVIILNQKDAALFDLHHEDRIIVSKGTKKTTAVLDIAESKKAVPQGHIGLFEEVLDALNAKHNDIVDISLDKKPVSTQYIRKKLEGKELNYTEIHEIISDIVKNKLTDIELTSYITANYTKGTTNKEIIALTKAMTQTGSVLNIKKKPVVDIHCVGGVPGNRTTMIVVPILAAAGLTVPKTSSRAITSPAGTADTMEVLCDVTLPVSKLKQILNTVGAFIVWGGSVNLAPADDKIIKIEHPLSIDAEGQMLASIMAKKASVSTTHLLLDLPMGAGTKIATIKKAAHLKNHFQQLGKELSINVRTIITDGSQPIGNGIGPALEARDCLWVLHNDKRAPQDLRKKSILMAGKALELAGKAPQSKGCHMAECMLNSGAAHEKMMAIIKAQNGKITHPEKIPLGEHTFVYCSQKTGTLRHIDNISISKIARIAGAPIDTGAGIDLHKHKGNKVTKGEPLFTIYAHSKQKLDYAKEILKEIDGIMVK
ncbi:AMP phosphorylase [Candidatus Woesearchaeota archaeon]|nr:AMP phosphorylase [Candidatus Woesearchaeota archaeon]